MASSCGSSPERDSGPRLSARCVEEPIGSAALPPRIGHSAVVTPQDATVVVFGGKCVSTGAVTNELWILEQRGDIAADEGVSWHNTHSGVDVDLSSTPSAHRHSIAAAKWRQVFLARGHSMSAPVAAAVSASDIEESRRGTADTALELPPARWHHTAVLRNDGSLIVYGGLSPSGECLGDLWLVNTFVAPVRAIRRRLPVRDDAVGVYAPAPRHSHAAAWLPSLGAMVVVGGHGAKKAFTDVHLYDDRLGEWAPLASSAALPRPLCGHALAYDSVRERLVVVGGRSTVSALHGCPVLETTVDAVAAAVPPRWREQAGTVANVGRVRRRGGPNEMADASRSRSTAAGMPSPYDAPPSSMWSVTYAPSSEARMRHPQHHPAPREGHAVAWISETTLLVLAGTSCTGAAAGLEPLGRVGAIRRLASAAARRQSGVDKRAGEASAAAALSDAWLLDCCAARWSQLPVPTGLPPLAAPVMAPVVPPAHLRHAWAPSRGVCFAVTGGCRDQRASTLLTFSLPMCPTPQQWARVYGVAARDAHVGDAPRSDFVGCGFSVAVDRFPMPTSTSSVQAVLNASASRAAALTASLSRPGRTPVRRDGGLATPPSPRLEAIMRDDVCSPMQLTPRKTLQQLQLQPRSAARGASRNASRPASALITASPLDVADVAPGSASSCPDASAVLLPAGLDASPLRKRATPAPSRPPSPWVNEGLPLGDVEAFRLRPEFGVPERIRSPQPSPRKAVAASRLTEWRERRLHDAPDVSVSRGSELGTASRSSTPASSVVRPGSAASAAPTIPAPVVKRTVRRSLRVARPMAL